MVQIAPETTNKIPDKAELKTFEQRKVAAVALEFHKLAQMQKPELYPKGVRSILEEHIKDLEAIKAEWGKSGRENDVRELGIQIKRRKEPLKRLYDRQPERREPTSRYEA